MAATSSSSRVRKYERIGLFAASIQMTRAGAFKALEREDPEVWGKYAAFMEQHRAEQREIVNEARARVSNAKVVNLPLSVQS